MFQKIKLPLGTEFVYDKAGKKLFPSALFGMCCSANGAPADDAAFGMAVICAGAKRLEGWRLEYEILLNERQKFVYAATDRDKIINFTGTWQFFEEYSLVSCSSTVTNTSNNPVTIRRALPRWCFAPGKYEVYFHHSRWGAENQLQRVKLCGNDIHLHGQPARSSIGNTPFCILKDTVNNTAAVFHVVPQGNWAININSFRLDNQLPMPVIEAGLSDTDLFFTLQPGESVELPEVLLQQSPAGDICAPAASLHRYFNSCRMPASRRTLPVSYNSWLYRFTGFTGEQLLEQARAAREIGCETFIVDAGWFGPGEGWGKVGDWREKTEAPFYGRMADFADEIRAMGLQFGFWMEPERWVEDIPVRAEHPEWFPEHTSRIDLNNPEAAEYVFNVIAGNIRKFKAAYIKIDFNAHTGYDCSGWEMYQYCAARYRLFERLHEEFPELVIENCGSGGLRNDLAMTMLFDQNFISDNADPWATVRIRQGLFMRNLPGRTLNWNVIRPAQERLTPETPGLKVMACTGACWDSGTICNLDFVLLSNLLGVPSFSGDIAGLTEEAKQLAAEITDFYKKNRDFFVTSCVHLLTAPASSINDCEDIAVMQMQESNGTDSLVFAFSCGSCRMAVRNFRLKDLHPAKSYKVRRLFNEHKCEYSVSGRELMEYGIKVEFVDMHIQTQSAALYQVTELPSPGDSPALQELRCR